MLRWLAVAALIVAMALAAIRLTQRTSPLPEAGPAGGVETARVALDVPHLRQEPELCVPTSAAMILAFYGDPQAPRFLKARAAGRHYDPAAPFTDFTATLYRDLLRATDELGYDWAEETFPETDEGLSRGMARIEAELAAGRPVMADVTLRPGVGHTFVVAGFDPVERTLFIVDPDRPAPGRRTMSYVEFGRVWNERAYGGRFRGLIRTEPRDSAA